MEHMQSSSDKESQKRLIGTLDPDYALPPDAKKIKLLQAKGEEEFYGRVVKVVEKQFMHEIERKNCEVEEIDDKILKIQQCLHTLRYCLSLHFYAFDKFKGRAQNDKPQINHPVIRRHIGQPTASVEALNTSELLSKSNPKHQVKDEQSSSTESSNLQKESGIAKKDIVPTDPSNKKNLNHPTCEVISQGRQGRYQRKARVVIGNTYQYMPDSEDFEDHLKIKWRIYVRGPPENSDLSSIISSVKFTLDKSYSPKDVIVVRKPPFILTQRGWGEFKVYLVLTFVDPRNKPIQMMHHLTLARPDDPLAFTGIWRMGRETWYDIWLYSKSTDAEMLESKEIPKATDSVNMNVKALEEKGIKTETLYSDNEGNMTLTHSCEKEVENKAQHATKQLSTESPKVDGTESPPIEKSLKQTDIIHSANPEVEVLEQQYPMMNGEADKDSGTIPKSLEDKSGSIMPKIKKGNEDKNEQKLHKILIRQADGSLVSWMVPKSMYNMALKFSEKNLSKSNVGSGSKKEVNVTPKNLPVNVALPNGNALKEKSALHNSDNNRSSTTETTNGLVTPISLASNNVKQSSLPPTKSLPYCPPTSSVPIPPRSTLIRLSPFIQKQSATPPNTNVQQQTALPPKQSPLLLPSAESDNTGGGAIRLTVPSQTLLATKGIAGREISATMTPTSTSNPIRLSVSTLSPSNAKVIKTALMGVGDKKTTTLSVNLKKAPAPMPLSIKVGQPLAAVNSGDGSVSRSQPSKVTLLNNGMMVNASHILRSCTLPPTAANGMKLATLKSSSLSLPPLRDVGTSATNTTGPTVTSPSGKITTRRIFISAPPHLVKLREAASVGQQGLKAEATSHVPSLLQEENAKLKMKLVEEDEKELSSFEKFEERKRFLRTQSTHCSSVDEVLRVYLKGLPLVITEETKHLDFPFIAPSLNHFKCCLTGRIRAIEFWRARLIKKELKILDIPNWQTWSTIKIVSWARRHSYTPASNLSNWALEKRCACRRRVSETLCPVMTLDKPGSQSSAQEISPNKKGTDFDSSELISVDSLENEEESSEKKKKENPVPLSCETKESEEAILLSTPDTAEESHFIDLILSKVRLKMEPEEVSPGMRMNLAKCLLWKATKSFMEDLIRSTYSEGILSHPCHPRNSPFPNGSGTEVDANEDSEITLEPKHLLGALGNGRPQFQLFSQHGLGREPPQLPSL